MNIRITSVNGESSSIEFEGNLSDWLRVLNDNCGAEEQTGSTEVEIFRELASEGKFTFVGCIGTYYVVDVVEAAAE